MEAIYEETPEVVKAKNALTKMFNRKWKSVLPKIVAALVDECKTVRL